MDGRDTDREALGHGTEVFLARHLEQESGRGGRRHRLGYKTTTSCSRATEHCHSSMVTSGAGAGVVGVGAAPRESQLAWFTARTKENRLKMSCSEVDATFGHQSDRPLLSLLPLVPPPRPSLGAWWRSQDVFLALAPLLYTSVF